MEPLLTTKLVPDCPKQEGGVCMVMHTYCDNRKEKCGGEFSGLDKLSNFHAIGWFIVHSPNTLYLYPSRKF